MTPREKGRREDPDQPEDQDAEPTMRAPSGERPTKGAEPGEQHKDRGQDV